MTVPTSLPRANSPNTEMMDGEDPPASLSLAVVCRRCREEIARYRRGEPHDERFCLELFRRAVAEHDENCWQELQSVYRDQVLSWCRRSAQGPETDIEELAALTWEKFWQHFTAEKLSASNGSAAVLLYLKMCARSAAVDVGRARGSARSLDEAPAEIADSGRLPAEEYARKAAFAQFWAMVNEVLRDQREAILVHLTYELGLKPAEIQAQRPDLFPSIKEVYQLTRNLLDRLRRNRELREWFEQEDI